MPVFPMHYSELRDLGLVGFSNSWASTAEVGIQKFRVEGSEFGAWSLGFKGLGFRALEFRV